VETANNVLAEIERGRWVVSDQGLAPAVVEMRSKLEAYGRSLACGCDPRHLAEILFRVYLADVPWWRRAWLAVRRFR